MKWNESFIDRIDSLLKCKNLTLEYSHVWLIEED